MLKDNLVDNPELRRQLAESPIELPEHPYFAELKNFGLDELLAAGVDPLSTTLLNSLLPAYLKPIILPITGPVTEKLAFYPAHFVKAKKVFNTTPEKSRKEFSYYFRKALKDGSNNLVKDIIYHDPLYVGFMSAGIAFTDIPPGVLSAISYTTAVFMAAGVEVARNELRHHNQKKILHKLGFQEESYYESRFYVLNDMHPEKVLETLAREFNLTDASTAIYHDTYYDNVIPVFSGRKAKMRLRKREKLPNETNKDMWGENPQWINTMQIVYTRAREHKNGIDQVRYFPVKKEKLYRFIPDDVTSIDMIADEQVRGYLQKLQDKSLKHDQVSFERTVARNNELAVCADKIDAEKPFYVVEFKAYKNTDLLQQAMRYLMVECPIAAVQTTHGKSDLLIS